ncbi:MAG: polyprenyl synthetase family protein [Phycisphaerales bacterium]|nr:polyprenyl synthetase family protein [Phycisphaerales bacterium]
MMKGLLELSDRLIPAGEALAAGLARVEARFAGQIASELSPVARLCAHVDRYRGKMLRPSLTLLVGMATAPEEGINDHHVTLGAVCELIHMATLVHDDVLDEADVRRAGKTINRLHGNEAAVILGDYLIASAYHLCSQVPDHRPALAVGRASMRVCEGELLQLHHRNDTGLDEATYIEIVSRKTGDLAAVACEMGAWASGASPQVCAQMATFGMQAGIAFQIQDDLLDLMGDEAVVGKSTGKDLEKGKLTLPLIHHLAQATPSARASALSVIESVRTGKVDAHAAGATLARAMKTTGSIEYARQKAAQSVSVAKQSLDALDDTPAREMLLRLADGVITRSF